MWHGFWSVDGGSRMTRAQAANRILSLKRERDGALGSAPKGLIAPGAPPSHFGTLPLSQTTVGANQASPRPFTTLSEDKLVGRGATQSLCPFVFLEFLPNLSIEKQPQAGSSLNGL